MLQSGEEFQTAFLRRPSAARPLEHRTGTRWQTPECTGPRAGAAPHCLSHGAAHAGLEGDRVGGSVGVQCF
jgi:hypothetical protein